MKLVRFCPTWRTRTEPAREQEGNRRPEKPCRTIKQDARKSCEINYMGFPEQSANSKFPACSASIRWQWPCRRDETVAATAVQFVGKDGGR